MYNYNRNQKNNRGQSGGAPYVWRVTWWNSREWGCPYKYKAFTSKQAALSFICKLQNNPSNNSHYQPILNSI